MNWGLFFLNSSFSFLNCNIPFFNWIYSLLNTNFPYSKQFFISQLNLFPFMRRCLKNVRKPLLLYGILAIFRFDTRSDKNGLNYLKLEISEIKFLDLIRFSCQHWYWQNDRHAIITVYNFLIHWFSLRTQPKPYNIAVMNNSDN